MCLVKNTQRRNSIFQELLALKSTFSPYMIYQQQAILMIYLLICKRYLFPLPFLFSLLYWFSDKVGVLCQESHFPDDLAQSVHQPTTPVSTFLALTLIVLLQNVIFLSNIKIKCPAFKKILRSSISQPCHHLCTIDIDGTVKSQPHSTLVHSCCCCRIKDSKYAYMIFTCVSWTHASCIHVSWIHVSPILASWMRASFFLDSCITDTCIMDTCIMDICILDTCIMDIYILDTCIMETIIADTSIMIQASRIHASWIHEYVNPGNMHQ